MFLLGTLALVGITQARKVLDRLQRLDYSSGVTSLLGVGNGMLHPVPGGDGPDGNRLPAVRLRLPGRPQPLFPCPQVGAW